MKADAAAIRQFRKLVVLVMGCTLLGVGALLVVLPGPGLPTMFGGLTLLATEFLWARRWLQRIKDELARRGLGPAARGNRRASAEDPGAPREPRAAPSSQETR